MELALLRLLMGHNILGHLNLEELTAGGKSSGQTGDVIPEILSRIWFQEKEF